METCSSRSWVDGRECIPGYRLGFELEEGVPASEPEERTTDGVQWAWRSSEEPKAHLGLPFLPKTAARQSAKTSIVDVKMAARG